MADKVARRRCRRFATILPILLVLLLANGNTCDHTYNGGGAFARQIKSHRNLIEQFLLDRDEHEGKHLLARKPGSEADLYQPFYGVDKGFRQGLGYGESALGILARENKKVS